MSFFKDVHREYFSRWYLNTLVFIVILLHIFQRYGYGGFVQLHHHCKVSQRTPIYVDIYLCIQKGHRYRGIYVFVLHATPGTQQALPGCTAPCGPVRLVLAMWAAAELSTLPLRQQRDTLQTQRQLNCTRGRMTAVTQPLRFNVTASCTCKVIVESVTLIHTIHTSGSSVCWGTFATDTNAKSKFSEDSNPHAHTQNRRIFN